MGVSLNFLQLIQATQSLSLISSRDLLYNFFSLSGGGHPKYLGLQGGPSKKISNAEGVITYYRNYPSNPTCSPYPVSGTQIGNFVVNGHATNARIQPISERLYSTLSEEELHIVLQNILKDFDVCLRTRAIARIVENVNEFQPFLFCIQRRESSTGRLIKWSRKECLFDLHCHEI